MATQAPGPVQPMPQAMPSNGISNHNGNDSHYFEENGNKDHSSGIAQPQIQTIYNMGYANGTSNGSGHGHIPSDMSNGTGFRGHQVQVPYMNNGHPSSVTGNGSEVESSVGEEYNSEYDYSDPVKLFVGQVPKTMEEADLFPIFEKYGPMDDVAIIRDKHTGQHRGCAFVTYLSKESAENCEKELHNTRVFEGGKRPVQVRPAGKKEGEFILLVALTLILHHHFITVFNTTKSNVLCSNITITITKRLSENKIFVGMLPRAVTEEMVSEVFQAYGEISGVFVIRSTDGYRKGCAFVKYTNRDAAYAAIEELNGKVVFNGSDRPLIVKIADTKGEKRIRQNRRDAALYGNESDSPSLNGQSPHGPYINFPAYHPSSPHIPMYAAPGIPTMDLAASNAGTSYGLPPPHHGGASPLPEYMYPYGMAEQHPPPAGPSYNTRPPRQPQASGSGPRPREGPAGANLFIYHLPHDLTDADLATAFNPFGNVISAKVYVDKYTGESKGFGFVSYDSIISAEQAIDLMNGFQIGNKRLKVQHKRVHHRPQQTMPPPNVTPNFYPHPGQQMLHPPPPMAYPDVPVPSIEISSKHVDDNATALHTLSQASSVVGQTDIDALTQSFSGLHADEGTENA